MTPIFLLCLLVLLFAVLIGVVGWRARRRRVVRRVVRRRALRRRW